MSPRTSKEYKATFNRMVFRSTKQPTLIFTTQKNVNSQSLLQFAYIMNVCVQPYSNCHINLTSLFLLSCPSFLLLLIEFLACFLTIVTFQNLISPSSERSSCPYYNCNVILKLFLTFIFLSTIPHCMKIDVLVFFPLIFPFTHINFELHHHKNFMPLVTPSSIQQTSLNSSNGKPRKCLPLNIVEFSMIFCT